MVLSTLSPKEGDNLLHHHAHVQTGTQYFQNHDVLDEEWTPKEIQGRDEEIDQYTQCLQPVINGWQPKNVFLYGKTGVGKQSSQKVFFLISNGMHRNGMSTSLLSRSPAQTKRPATK